MNEKLKIKGNKVKVFDGFWENDKIAVVMILLILYYSIGGNTRSVELRKIAFILDAIKKEAKISKLSTLLSSPWEISEGLRKRVILAHETGLLYIQDNKGNISFTLTSDGINFVQQIENDKILPDLAVSIKLWAKAVSVKQLKNQQLIW